MKISHRFLTVALAAAAFACVPLRGEAREIATGVRIVSPDSAQTWAINAVTTHYKLFWDDRKNELLALLTFTNSPRVSRYELLTEQQSTFRLPGVWLDEASQTLYTRGGSGSGDKGGGSRGVPVATLRGGGFLTERVRPAPGTLVRVRIDRRGTVSVVLYASHRPLRGPVGADDEPQVSHWEIDGSVQPF
jgi:hypothetical protein